MPETSRNECASCGAALPPAQRFCGACGSAAADDLPTLSSPRPAGQSRPPTSHRTSASGPGGAEEPRFVPGTILAGRYRIVALLGRGGMGEVYRADDLTLSQPVALKFLPEAAVGEEMLARFRNEVRIARRVSHRNVCRVYDIGEAEGRTFLSMEYVDGEDLSSLLKRIGRLPPDKALDVARRVCAGLAAAHEKGVLHRDLKPANVMLDRQGEVVLTDFGLAVFAGQVPERDLRSGTPSYMAPEQLAGAEVTVKSDLYALGLVLYETFTGRRAFDARRLAGALAERSGTKPESPSSVVRDLDPAVERAILWCLEPEPDERPRSALAVAAALPGGDPLAAALAAGETPSPEVVAEAGRTTGLRPRVALAALAAVVLSLGAILAIAVRVGGLDRVGVQPPEALQARAVEILGRLGYSDAPYDSAFGFGQERDLIRHLERASGSRPDWNRLLAGRPPVVYFWYRTSPRRLTNPSPSDDSLTPGIVDVWEPPAVESGMVNVGLDARGRLNFLQVLPPEREEPQATPAPAPDWDALFAAAELDRRLFQPATPQWNSLAAADTRAAWTGTWPGGALPLRVEAAAFRGKAVYFQLVGPWTNPYRMQPDTRSAREKVGGAIGLAVGVLVVAAAVLLARRNHASGRADRRGALRLGAVVFGLQLAVWVCRAHHSLATDEVGLLFLATGHALFGAAITWLLYLALEPYVRKHWPQALISWTRLLGGRVRDPLVGRDLLSGVLLGLLWALLLHVFILLVQGQGASPQLGYHGYLLGGRRGVGMAIVLLLGSISGTLIFFFAAFLLRALLRRTWLAGTVFVLLFSLQQILASQYVRLETPFLVAVYTIAFVAVARFGLLTLAAGLLSANLLLTVPVPESLSSWYANAAVFVFGLVAALAAWGFYTSLGDQKLWKGDVFEA
ncbi:MAG: serine/threonine-protein kinase [Vicinamibacteria bacterium]